VPAENAGRLAAMLRGAGAVVEHKALPVGHGLSQADVTFAKAWLNGFLNGFQGNSPKET